LLIRTIINILKCRFGILATGLLVAFLSFPFAITANAASLSHSGLIIQDTTWLSNDNHTVTGDVKVLAGVTLTIEAGATVQFTALSDDQGGGAEAALAELIIEGELVSEGTAVSPIVFTSNAVSPVAGDWGGIRQSGGGDITLRYATINYASVGVLYEADGGVIAAAVIENTTVHDTTSTGLYFNLTNSAVLTLTLNANVITNAGGHGIFAGSRTGSSMTSTVTNNQVQNTGSRGIYVYAQDTTSTHHSAVSGNTVDTTVHQGLYLYSNHYNNTFTVLADNNAISNTGSEGIYTYYPNSLVLTNNQVTTAGSYGIYTHQNSEDGGMTVSGNTVTGTTNYGIYLYPHYTSGAHSIINNTVTNAVSYGIYYYDYGSIRVSQWFFADFNHFFVLLSG